MRWFPLQANSIRGFLKRFKKRLLTFLCIRTCSLYLLCVCSRKYTMCCGFFHLTKMNKSFLQRLPALKSLMQLLISKSLASALFLRWPTTVTSKLNAHSKFKSLTALSNRSQQIQVAHSKFKSPTANSNRSQQIPNY